jgi:hypothetical protein
MVVTNHAPRQARSSLSLNVRQKSTTSLSPQKSEPNTTIAHRKGEPPPSFRSLVRGCFLCLAVVGGIVGIIAQGLSHDFLESAPTWFYVLTVITVVPYLIVEIRWGLKSIYGDSAESENSISKTDSK